MSITMKIEDEIFDPGNQFTLEVEGKTYDLTAPPLPGQDGSDLALFPEIVVKANAYSEKSVKTCIAIQLIWGIVQDMIERRREADPPEQAQFQSRILTMQYAAVRIWREGKLAARKTEPSPEDLGRKTIISGGEVLEL